MKGKLVLLRTYQTSWEANVARVRLEEHGITVFVENHHLGYGHLTGLQGARLVVPEDQLAAAEKVLAKSADDE